MKKQLLALVLCIAVGLSGCGKNPVPNSEDQTSNITNDTSSADSMFKPGTYTGEAAGYGGTMKVEVDVDANKITAVRIVEHKESAGVSDPALKQLPTEIVEKQSVALDTVAGCTFSSKAILEAVTKALQSSGADISKLQTKPDNNNIEKKTEEKTADVVVVGGGGAGLSAAVSAYEHGAKSVILIEKMPALGGNTLRAGGAYNAVNPEKQKKQNIEDSVDKHYKQTLKGGHNVGNPELVRVLVDNALDGIHWLESYGVEFKPEIGSVVGSMWPRSNQTVAPLGTGYINGLEKAARSKGCEILLGTAGTEIIMKDGRAVGVRASSKDTDYVLNATNGVIIATGGYAANPDMVREYLSDGVYTTDNLPADIVSTNAPGLQGDGIKMGEAVGAQLIDMQHVQLLPMPSDRFGPSINVEDSFFINKEGKRYVREDGARDEICLATFKQTDGQYFMINDSKIIGEGRKTLSGEDLDELIAKGLVVEANSIEELAKAINVPADALSKTLENFNSYVDAKKDPEFGRAVWGNKIDTAPYYATLRFPALHHTMGGLKINTSAQVLDTKAQPIPGLFAAGEVTGGIHGANRLGGNAIADIIVFGRIAGENVMTKNAK